MLDTFCKQFYIWNYISAKLTLATALTISQWLGFESLICHGQRYFNYLQIQINVLQLSKGRGKNKVEKKINYPLYVHLLTSDFLEASVVVCKMGSTSATHRALMALHHFPHSQEIFLSGIITQDVIGFMSISKFTDSEYSIEVILDKFLRFSIEQKSDS